MKKIFLITLILIIITQNKTLIYADNTFIITEGIQVINNTQIEPCAEIREYKYRIYNGKLQRRLWSVTYGYWIDDKWTDVR